MIKLTKSELAILCAIDRSPNKVLDFSNCRKEANLTIRGARTVINRMIDCSLIGRSELPETFRQPTLTFKGVRALKEYGH